MGKSAVLDAFLESCAREPVQGLRIADVVAMDKVQRQSQRDGGLERLRADEVAAMDHRLGAQRLRLAHRPRERIGAVMAVRDDADFHAPILARKQRGAIPLRICLIVCIIGA